MLSDEWLFTRKISNLYHIFLGMYLGFLTTMHVSSRINFIIGCAFLKIGLSVDQSNAHADLIDIMKLIMFTTNNREIIYNAQLMLAYIATGNFIIEGRVYRFDNLEHKTTICNAIFSFGINYLLCQKHTTHELIFTAGSVLTPNFFVYSLLFIPSIEMLMNYSNFIVEMLRGDEHNHIELMKKFDAWNYAMENCGNQNIFVNLENIGDKAFRRSMKPIIKILSSLKRNQGQIVSWFCDNK